MQCNEMWRYREAPEVVRAPLRLAAHAHRAEAPWPMRCGRPAKLHGIATCWRAVRHSLRRHKTAKTRGAFFLQEMAFSRTGIRAVTTSRTLIACYRMVARSEGAAFCDATGSVISKIRVRPNKPNAEMHTFALSVPCFAGGGS